MERRWILAEVGRVYALVALATLGAMQLRRVPFLADHVHLVVGAVFLLTALRMAVRVSSADSEREALDEYGIALGGLLAPADESAPRGWMGLPELLSTTRAALPSALRECGVALGVAALVFPPFTLGFGWWHVWRHGVDARFSFGLPEDALSFALAQLVVVALPEEAFFRGYVQTRLDALWPRGRWPVHPLALALQSALFAAIHVVGDLNASRLAVFFPGLLFGLLRGWRGGIGAAMVFHALSNIYSDFLTRGWLG